MRTLFLLIMLLFSTVTFANTDKPTWRVKCSAVEAFSQNVVLLLLAQQSPQEQRKQFVIDSVNELAAKNQTLTDEGKRRVLLDQLFIVDSAYYVFTHAVIPYQPSAGEITAFKEQMHSRCETKTLPSQSMDAKF